MAGDPTGDLQIRVEWADVPIAARSSPGRTPCNTPRSPAVAPTTTWGIPDALVIVEGAAPETAVARVALAGCTVSPPLVTGSSLAITSAVDRPAKLVLRKRGPLERSEPGGGDPAGSAGGAGGKAPRGIDRLGAGDPLSVMLPIAGHTVTTAIDDGAIYSLETDAAEPEIVFVAAIPNAYVTGANGQVTAYRLTPGPHAITAWLPPRAGQPARIGRGTARVVAGDLTSLTISLDRLSQP